VGNIVGTTQTLSRWMTVRESSSGHWDEAEFRAVFFRLYARIVGVLVRLVGDQARAEEVANDAFMRLYRQPAMQADGNIGGWLYRTAMNLGIDAVRASNRRHKYEEKAGREIEHATVDGPLDDLLREEKCERVRGVLATIKPVNAQLLLLRTSGFSYKEIAEALDLKATGIGSMLIRAEAEFRNRYLALHPNEEGL
jgi:RNA polymerase sigma-70 factor (ECF subfamily)